MRMINASLDSIWVYEEDADKKASKTAERVEKRRATLAKVGISVDASDLTRSINVALTEGQLADLLVAGESVSVSSSFNIDAPVMRAAEVLTSVAAKLEQFAASVPDVNNHYNERVEVYTPGMGLMLFNRVMLLNDACSDELQTQLDTGWRIIAACPQPDQRRPDYILGRYDPQHALDSGANTNALRG